MKKSRYVSPKSQKKMSSRRAAAAAVVSLGAGILGTQSAEAGIVTIDLTDVGGQNFTGENAGLTFGGIKQGVISVDANRRFLLTANLYFNQSVPYSSSFYEITGPTNTGDFYNDGAMADFGTGGNCVPLIYSEGASIGGTYNFVAGKYRPTFQLTYVTYSYRYDGGSAPSFDGYLGFVTSPGSDGLGVYGWIKASWDGTNFQFYSAAYESTPGVTIRAGDTGASAAVPEPTTMAIFGLGALVLGAGKVRKQRAARRQKQAEALSV